MRCTRCDRIAVPQAVGVMRSGLVVFGWCMACLEEEECELVEVSGWGVRAATRPARRHAARPEQREMARRSRQFALRSIAALMGFWAGVLIVVGAAQFPATGSQALLQRDWSRLLVAGGGVMALMSLALWAISLEGLSPRKLLLQAVQIGGAVLAFGVLTWGILHHEPRRDAAIVGVAFFAISLSWLGYWLAGRSGSAPPPSLYLPRKQWWRSGAARLATFMLAGTSRAIRKLAAGRSRERRAPRRG